MRGQKKKKTLVLKIQTENSDLRVTTVKKKKKKHVKFNNSLVKCEVSPRGVNEAGSGTKQSGVNVASPRRLWMREAAAAGALRLSCDFSTKRGWKWKEGRREGKKERQTREGGEGKKQKKNKHVPVTHRYF